MACKDAGFTVIELMTAVAVLVLTVTLGFPAFQGMHQRLQVTTTLNLLSADMAMARNSAVTRRSQVVVCPREGLDRCHVGMDWSHGWLVFEDADGNRQPDDASDLLRVTDAPASDSAVLYLPSTRPFVRYQPDGRSANTNLTIYICHHNSLVASAAINNLGRMRTERAPTEAACPRA